MNEHLLITAGDLLNTDAAGQWLSEALPEKTPKEWVGWLRNNRNQSRQAGYRISTQRFGRKAVYRHDDLSKFVEWEKSRQLGTIKLSGRAAEVMQAFGLGEAGGGNYGRKLACSVQLAFEEADASKQFVRLMIERPLSVFRLEVEEAEKLAKDLQGVAQEIRNHANESTAHQSDQSSYETVIANDDLTVKRRRAPK